MMESLLRGQTVRGHYQAAAAWRREMAAVPEHAWAARQLAALQTVWADAATDVPYYAGLVESGRAPRALGGWDEVRALPALTRADIQRQPDAFIRRSRAPESTMRTAGSTGTPLRLGMDQAERDIMRVVKLAAWQSLGYEERSRLFLIWGHSHLLGTGLAGRYNHLKRRLADVYLGYRRVDAYRLNRDNCRAYAEEILRFRPVGIIGYASALDLFARYNADYRGRFHALGLRFVLATAEPPPRPDTIPLLEDVFGCTVVQEYGGAEFGQVAFKAGAAPFEVFHDLNYVEVLASGAGGEQPLLVTSLYPRYVPLIRYEVGDCVEGARLLPHGHAAGFEVLRGRVNDVLRLADGYAIHSVAIFHCIHQEPSVFNIQMVLADDGIRIRLVAAADGRAQVESRVRARLAQVHPALAAVTFEFVEDLATTRAGKRRWFVDERTEPCAALPAS